MKRQSDAHVKGILRNVFDKELMTEIEKLPINKILDIYVAAPEKYLEMHTLNCINWIHNRERLYEKEKEYKDKPEELQKIKDRIKNETEITKPIKNKTPEDKDIADSDSSSCGGFFSWLICALEDIAEFIAGLITGIIAGFKGAINLPDVTPSIGYSA